MIVLTSHAAVVFSLMVAAEQDLVIIAFHSVVVDHVCPCMTAVNSSLNGGFEQDTTTLISSQAGFLNMSSPGAFFPCHTGCYAVNSVLRNTWYRNWCCVTLT